MQHLHVRITRSITAPTCMKDTYMEFAMACENHVYILLALINIFYSNSRNVGMAQKVQKRVRSVTQRSINHGSYMQERRTL